MCQVGGNDNVDNIESSVLVHGIFPFIFKNCFHQFISCPCIDVVDVLSIYTEGFFFYCLLLFAIGF